MRIRLPHEWRPRPYQMAAWTYLENGGKHAELVWHRRSGKDDLALHRTCVAAFERVSNLWHMLPLANQVRKAIWDAVNPHSGKRRIDEAFPQVLRESTRDNDMLIRFKNGSTWQALGSDNFQAAIGSTPAGIVYSEWAQSNPSAKGYLRPILLENNGWQIFITTPRGKNHAHRTFKAAQRDPKAFAQLLTAGETGVFTQEQLSAELASYIADHGEDQGEAMYLQEYFCSFEAAVLGAYYTREIAKFRASGRMQEVVYDPGYPVHTVWDLGRSDDTVIFWFQVIAGEVRILKHHQSNFKDLDYYTDLIKEQRGADGEPMVYGLHWLPHDAMAKRLGTKKSIEEQVRDALGSGSVRIVPRLSVTDGIQAARKLWAILRLDLGCDEALELLAQYRREWDDDKKCFREQPVHDFTSHTADAFRYLAVAWREELPASPADEKPRYAVDRTIDEIIRRNAERKGERL